MAPLPVQPFTPDEPPASSESAKTTTNQITYEPGAQVSRRQFRFLLSLTLLNTLMLGAFIAGPGISRVTSGWWQSYQRWQADRKAAQQAAAAQQKFTADYQACLQRSAPATQVVYEEDPQRAAKLLAGRTGYVGVSSSSYMYFSPEPWQLSVYLPATSIAAKPRAANGAALFVHARKAADGVERLVWVELRATQSMAQMDSREVPQAANERRYRMRNSRSLIASICTPTPNLALDRHEAGALSILQPYERAPSAVWISGSSWENGHIEPHLQDVFRFFAGQPDPGDDSHFTLPYELDGKPEVIDGWLKTDQSVVLQPRAGRIVQQDPLGRQRTWNPYAEPPATQPVKPTER